jgi:hypothetical protein
MISGYDGSTAKTWAKNVDTWGKYLQAHPLHHAYVSAVKAINEVLHQALSPTPDVVTFKANAEKYHRIMLTNFPKVKFRIYDHALLVHVPAILAQGTLIDGSSWFLEALNKVWKSELLYHTNNGGGKKRDAELDKAGKHSKEGQSYNRALRWNTMDEQALRSVWVKTMPQLSAVVDAWECCTKP